MLYEKPIGEFISFSNDIIYSESKQIEAFKETGLIVNKRILAINVKMQHSEIEESSEIKVVGVNTKLETT